MKPLSRRSVTAGLGAAVAAIRRDRRMIRLARLWLANRLLDLGLIYLGVRLIPPADREGLLRYIETLEYIEAQKH